MTSLTENIANRSRELGRQVVLAEIVELAEAKIKRAGCTSVDRIAHMYCELLSELGAEEESQQVYQLYQRIWSG